MKPALLALALVVVAGVSSLGALLYVAARVQAAIERERFS